MGDDAHEPARGGRRAPVARRRAPDRDARRRRVGRVRVVGQPARARGAVHGGARLQRRVQRRPGGGAPDRAVGAAHDRRLRARGRLRGAARAARRRRVREGGRRRRRSRRARRGPRGRRDAEPGRAGRSRGRRARRRRRARDGALRVVDRREPRRDARGRGALQGQRWRPERARGDALPARRARLRRARDDVRRRRRAHRRSARIPLAALGRGLYVAATLQAVGMAGAAKWLLGPHWVAFFAAGLVGVVAAASLFPITAYFAEARHRPVRAIADASRAGVTLSLLEGMATGADGAVVVSLIVLGVAGDDRAVRRDRSANGPRRRRARTRRSASRRWASSARPATACSRSTRSAPRSTARAASSRRRSPRIGPTCAAARPCSTRSATPRRRSLARTARRPRCSRRCSSCRRTSTRCVAEPSARGLDRRVAPRALHASPRQPGGPDRRARGGAPRRVGRRADHSVGGRCGTARARRGPAAAQARGGRRRRSAVPASVWRPARRGSQRPGQRAGPCGVRRDRLARGASVDPRAGAGVGRRARRRRHGLALRALQR